MKLALILMVRNEEKILRRCLEAVENVVDCFCVCDTGSNDRTVEIAEEFLKTRSGCLTTEPWKNFGHNRTLSFQNAQKYIRDELKWDASDTYGLLLDADMVFVPNALKSQKLTGSGYNILQVNSVLEYYNCRLVRMDGDWKCLGVTHEYWDVPTTALTREVCYISDRDDGGCKQDKFQRDQALLERGLIDEPANVRYMFYLAQTYKGIGMMKESIQMYKRRIKAGGWSEEVWYSHYMIGEMYLAMNNIPKFEYWMLRAHAFSPHRAEPIYKLAKHFRVVGHHHKAYYYATLGKGIKYPSSDVLFVERDVYNGAFDYEMSVLEYYVHPDQSEMGLRASLNYMMRAMACGQSVIQNIKFYTKPISADIVPLSIPEAFGPEFRPSAVSVCNYPFANVRYVNYAINPISGGYMTRNNGNIHTQNALINLDTGECVARMDESTIGIPACETHVYGLEDIRLTRNETGDVVFCATSVRQYAGERVGIVRGKYAPTGYADCVAVASPLGQHCEKNWLGIDGTDSVIYGWSPMRVGRVEGAQLVFTHEHKTPPMFAEFRGSCPPKMLGGSLVAMVHFVDGSGPVRKYYHCFVELDRETYEPRRVSMPFVFWEASIEYCLSFRVIGAMIECYVSRMDSDPARIRFPASNIKWVPLSGHE
jgi:glycosyltransferase involved in cell wall biosynthesis